MGNREPCEGGLKRSGFASVFALGLSLLLLSLLARRRKMRFGVGDDEVGVRTRAGRGTRTARRQIRPDCGSRKRGIEAVVDAMAAGKDEAEGNRASGRNAGVE